MAQDFSLSSPAFAEGDEIPRKYTCKGEDISPPLTIEGTPVNTAALALILHDPDAPNGDFLHWTVWNLPPNVREIPEASLPDSAFEGVTDFGRPGYGGPCPPSGTHRYIFELYALDEQLELESESDRQALTDAMADHIIAQARLTGTVSAD